MGIKAAKKKKSLAIGHLTTNQIKHQAATYMGRFIKLIKSREQTYLYQESIESINISNIKSIRALSKRIQITQFLTVMMKMIN